MYARQTETVQSFEHKIVLYTHDTHRIEYRMMCRQTRMDSPGSARCGVRATEDYYAVSRNSLQHTPINFNTIMKTFQYGSRIETLTHSNADYYLHP